LVNRCNEVIWYQTTVFDELENCLIPFIPERNQFALSVMVRALCIEVRQHCYGSCQIGTLHLVCVIEQRSDNRILGACYANIQTGDRRID
jgi:hypothetical protein